MKQYLLPIAFITSLAIASTAQAGSQQGNHGQDTIDYARVISVDPIYDSVSYKEPYQSCHYEDRVLRQASGSKTPVIIGGLIGGAIGNKLGHNKSNKRVGAVAGAILGGSIAADIHRNKHHGHAVRSERICHTAYEVRYKQAISGYNVAYKYRGRTYFTTRHQHPGDRIKVAVSVRPVDY
ncbi:MAG: glycine zipper 2TM domain-containing protein [Pseudomonadota bacterium]